MTRLFIRIALATVVVCLGLPASGALVSHWTFDSDFNDVVGSNDGTLLGSATAPGPTIDTSIKQVGPGSVNLLGGDDAVNTGKGTLSITGNQMSTAAWIYRTAAGSQHGIVGKTLSGNASYTMSLRSNGELMGGIQPSEGPWAATAVDGAKVPLNTWTHVAVVYDGSTLSRYVNGALTGTSKTVTGTNLDIRHASNVNFAIGDGGVGRGWQFPGNLDDVAVWNEALTAAQVVNAMNLGASSYQGASPPSLIRLGYSSVNGNDLLDPTVYDMTRITNATEMSVGTGGLTSGTAADATNIVGDMSSIYIPGSNGTLQTLSEAITANQTMEFDFDIQGLAADEAISLSQLSYQVRPNTNNAGSPARYGPMTYQWQGSVNGAGFFDLGSEINFDLHGDNDGILDSGEVLTNAKTLIVDLAGLDDLGNGDHIALRLAFWNGDNTGGGNDWNGSTRFGNLLVEGAVFQAQTAAVPEPSSLLLYTLGLFGFGIYGWRRRK